FGLILFVFAIGLQLGPGFFATLRRQGVQLNLLAAAVVLLGALGAPLAGWLAGFDSAAVLGVFAGASVNMPSLGAATQAISALPDVAAGRRGLPALACAVTFPTAIVASIVTLLLLRRLFNVDPVREAAEHAARNGRPARPLERRTLVVIRPELDGLRLDALPRRREAGVSIARVRHGDTTRAATGATVVRAGDRLAVVGTPAGLDDFERAVGARTDEDLMLPGSNVTYRRVVVTDRAALGRTVAELRLDERFGVAVTRITRSNLELAAVPGLPLQFGDLLQVVGAESGLDQAAAALGNAVKELNETHFIALFLGLFLGIVLGTVPLAFPGLPQPVRFGLAGGPLIVALLLGRFGRIGRLVCHMPVSANLAFRDFGIALFFAAVGLDAGAKFFATVFSPVGLQWLLAGACVTMGPLLLVGIFARAVLRMNFTDLSGLLAGSTTNPPALTFANSLAGADSPTVAYAAVYPLTMLLRILAAQVLALVLLP
ncbi:MAG TPA: putative transporter, partial [Verrucomicrobiota bacterium]|nr:putative transporter [Verrucomicrobiota bacterium]